jgi:hypothetical protein
MSFDRQRSGLNETYSSCEEADTYFTEVEMSELANCDSGIITVIGGSYDDEDFDRL